MDDIGAFLAYAIKLEEEAAARFSELADAMHTYGNSEVSEFFRRMAAFSRMHLSAARARAGFRDLPRLTPADFQWPEGQSPETASAEGMHYLMTLDYAFRIALESERAARQFYADVARTTEDPEVRSLAEAFAAEEAEHVTDLERWQARYTQNSGA